MKWMILGQGKNIYTTEIQNGVLIQSMKVNFFLFGKESQEVKFKRDGIL